MTTAQNADLLALADLVGSVVADGVTDADRDRILTNLRNGALDAVRELDADMARNRVQAVKLLRDRTGCGLYEGVKAVDWAIQQVKATNLDRHRVPSTHGWVYEFPNGYNPTVINDPSRSFRFEIHCRRLDVPGDVLPALTSEQVEAKLHHIAALPAH